MSYWFKMSYFVFIFLLEVENQKKYILQELCYPSKNCYTETFLSSSLFVFDIHICCLKLAGCIRCIWIVKDESCCGRQPVKSEPGTQGSLFPAKFINTADTNRLAQELSSKGDIVSQVLARFTYRNFHWFQGVQLFTQCYEGFTEGCSWFKQMNCWQKEMYSWNLALFSDRGLTTNRWQFPSICLPFRMKRKSLNWM